MLVIGTQITVLSKDTLVIPSNLDSTFTSENLVSELTKYYSINDSVKSSFRSSPNSIDIFYQNKSLSANLKSRIAVLEVVTSRTIIRETNFLHLNHPKKIWTWVADIFALGLVFLAVTGLFMIKGKKGFTGRGKWFALLGFLIPILFLLLYF